MSEDESDKADDQTDEAAAAEPELDEDGNPIEPPAKKGKKKLFIIIGAVMLLLIGGGAGAYFMGMLDGVLGKTEAAEGEEHAEGDHGDDHGGGKDKHAKKKDDGHGGGHDDGHGGDGHSAPGGIVFLEMPPITVGLLTDDGSSRFLRLKVQLELANDTDKNTVNQLCRVLWINFRLIYANYVCGICGGRRACTACN